MSGRSAKAVRGGDFAENFVVSAFAVIAGTVFIYWGWDVTCGNKKIAEKTNPELIYNLHDPERTVSGVDFTSCWTIYHSGDDDEEQNDDC